MEKEVCGSDMHVALEEAMLGGHAEWGHGHGHTHRSGTARAGLPVCTTHAGKPKKVRMLAGVDMICKALDHQPNSWHLSPSRIGSEGKTVWDQSGVSAGITAGISAWETPMQACQQRAHHSRAKGRCKHARQRNPHPLMNVMFWRYRMAWPPKSRMAGVQARAQTGHVELQLWQGFYGELHPHMHARFRLANAPQQGQSPYKEARRVLPHAHAVGAMH